MQPNIVFDGYDIHNTKGQEYIQRVGLIRLLSTHLKAAGCKVHQAEVDANRLIVATTINKRYSRFESVLVGEDTDVLVLFSCFGQP